MSIRNTRDIEELKQRVEALEKRLDFITAPPSDFQSTEPRQKRKYTRKETREINV